MSKAFITETDTEEDGLDEQEEALPLDVKNYMTPRGFSALQEELHLLQRTERPKIVEIVSWAAGNGDRSENGDYLYGKKRLREIDRRIRYLGKRLESAEVVDPRKQQGLDRVFFGATVTYAHKEGAKHTVTLVGPDEADLSQGKINWLSPVAKTLMKSRVGDVVEINTPSGPESLEVLSISYLREPTP
ncbi:MAG: transcription elongation factor GreB [Proteobacteria bacterium]|nr:transcription elongation factor GreB [Pseudomonadota bacterium]